MSKKIRITLLSLYLIGLVTFLLSGLFKSYLSDFAAGFFEGLSLVFILTGFVYCCWSIAHKQNPFKID